MPVRKPKGTNWVFKLQFCGNNAWTTDPQNLVRYKKYDSHARITAELKSKCKRLS